MHGVDRERRAPMCVHACAFEEGADRNVGTYALAFRVSVSATARVVLLTCAWSPGRQDIRIRLHVRMHRRAVAHIC